MSVIDLKNLDSIRSSGLMPTEEQEQILLFQWAKRNESQYPELRWLYHTPNGGHRSKSQGAMLKLAGVKKGVPDIALPVPVAPYHGLWIEMKTLDPKSRPSKEQKDWLAFLDDQGYRTVVAKGFEAARDAILDYLNTGAGK